MKIKNIVGVAFSLSIILLISFAVYWQAKAPIAVVVQAGHEGRVGGNTGAVSGKLQEVKWNIIVANSVAKQLKAWDIEVKRVPADTKLTKAKLAVAIHFDGSSKQCTSGASIGYKNESSKEFAKHWKRAYSHYFPFAWQEDNFTKNLANYYGYYYIRADKFLVLELGEITCNKQTKWLKPRLKKIGQLIAYTIAKELGFAPRKPF